MAAYRKLMFGKLAEQQGNRKQKQALGNCLGPLYFTCMPPEQILTKQKSLCTSCWHC